MWLLKKKDASVEIGNGEVTYKKNDDLIESESDTSSGSSKKKDKDKPKDTTPPQNYEITIDQSLIHMNNQLELSFKILNAELGSTYYYEIDDTDETTTKISGNGSSSLSTVAVTDVDVSSLIDDTLMLKVYLMDAKQNKGAVETETIEKDTTAPSGYTVGIDQEKKSPVKIIQPFHLPYLIRKLGLALHIPLTMRAMKLKKFLEVEQ